MFAWLASVGHWLDVGGNVPGNFNAKATESFQEGFRIPPVKLVRSGCCSRTSSTFWPPIRASRSRTGATSTANSTRSISESVASTPCSTNTATRHRGRARGLERPRGKADARQHRGAAGRQVRCDDFLDNDGVTDNPLRIALDLTIAGDRMRLDFSRSAPPCDGPLNIAYSTTVACCYVALKHLFTTFPPMPAARADRVRHPDTTLLGSRRRARSAGYTETILRVIDVIFGAFAKAAPERANGSPFATINALSLAGWRASRPALGDVLLLRRRARRQP